MGKKPRVAVFKFASCDGCQLTLLDAEDELLPIADAVDFVHFAEASSDLQPGPYDIALVEGSITTHQDCERLKRVRADSRFLVSIGACATAGGIQALRNFSDHREFMRQVYAHPEFIETLATSTPIADHVTVDFELRGCPIDKAQLIEVLMSLIAGHRPRTSTESVCQPCKRRGTVCVVVAHNTACLGPVTQAGCGSICPAYERGCFGCFGPAPEPNLVALTNGLLDRKQEPKALANLLRNFNVAAPPFLEASQKLLAMHDSPGNDAHLTGHAHPRGEVPS